MDAATAEALELVAFRRRGANRVHFALVMPETISDATYLGAACQVIVGPLVAWCGRTLNGDKFVIPDEHLDGWKQQGHVCQECRLIGRMALENARR
jgi:hypothetical protein